MVDSISTAATRPDHLNPGTRLISDRIDHGLTSATKCCANCSFLKFCSYPNVGLPKRISDSDLIADERSYPICLMD